MLSDGLYVVSMKRGESMKTGVLICGLNGAGKSTLGKALAARLGFHFIDNEDLYFPKTDPDYMYASARSREEVEALLCSEIKMHENFIFVSVKGDYKIVEESLAAGKNGNGMPADTGGRLPAEPTGAGVLALAGSGKAVDSAGAVKWYVVWIEVPRDIRLKRVRDRSFAKFGERMLPGGDLQEQEESFFRFAEERAEDTVETWLRTVGCPVIQVDGTKSAEENVAFLAKRVLA